MNLLSDYRAGIENNFKELLPNRWQPAEQVALKDSNRLLKQGIWLYFLLLIFEGAFRKWFLPDLATPLLIVRDPVALWIVVAAWQRGLLPSNTYLTGMIIVGIPSIFTAIFLGHGNLPVAIYGARILLIHFPLVFAIGRIFNSDDVVRMGKVTLLIAIPMAVLIALQFYSPQSAWVNRGVGGDMEGAGFNGGALGFYRPPGTFSFTTGNNHFFGLVACFVFYFWLNAKGINKLILLGATAALFAAIPLSISRSLLFQVILSLIFAAFAVLRKPEYVGRMILAACILIFALSILSNTDFFQTATEVFTIRFENASEFEGGLKGTFVDRYLGEMIKPIIQSLELPVFGYGIGMGTNVGSMLLTGRTGFLIAEGEWGRVIGELGILMGFAVIFLRVGFMVKILFASYRKVVSGDLLPWMLLSFGMLNVIQGQWAQPTSLGFSTLTAGLILASLRSTSRLV